uniref:Uncharacterized protein n=1 Tax=Haptolina ericina TaxID=156174 RepID=A0A7S3BV88_9EUKA
MAVAPAASRLAPPVMGERPRSVAGRPQSKPSLVQRLGLGARNGDVGEFLGNPRSSWGPYPAYGSDWFGSLVTTEVTGSSAWRHGGFDSGYYGDYYGGYGGGYGDYYDPYYEGAMNYPITGYDGRVAPVARIAASGAPAGLSQAQAAEAFAKERAEAAKEAAHQAQEEAERAVEEAQQAAQAAQDEEAAAQLREEEAQKSEQAAAAAKERADASAQVAADDASKAFEAERMAAAAQQRPSGAGSYYQPAPIEYDPYSARGRAAARAASGRGYGW